MEVVPTPGKGPEKFRRHKQSGTGTVIDFRTERAKRRLDKWRRSTPPLYPIALRTLVILLLVTTVAGLIVGSIPDRMRATGLLWGLVASIFAMAVGLWQNAIRDRKAYWYLFFSGIAFVVAIVVCFIYLHFGV